MEERQRSRNSVESTVISKEVIHDQQFDVSFAFRVHASGGGIEMTEQMTLYGRNERVGQFSEPGGRLQKRLIAKLLERRQPARSDNN